MNIEIRTYNGSGNWITARETKPDKTEDGLGRVFYEASWSTNGGRAEITPVVVHNDDHLAAVLVGYRYSGKYRGGSQYWRYYRNEDADGWTRVNWKQLDDGDRMTILDEFEGAHVPGWANIPGKLTRDYIKPSQLRKLEIDEQGTIYAYKYLLYADGQYRSPRYPDAIWQNDELHADAEPTEENAHGIYAMKTANNPRLEKYSHNARLVKIACSGTIVEANEGLRTQHAQIVEVLQ